MHGIRLEKTDGLCSSLLGSAKWLCFAFGQRSWFAATLRERNFSDIDSGFSSGSQRDFPPVYL